MHHKPKTQTYNVYKPGIFSYSILKLYLKIHFTWWSTTYFLPQQNPPMELIAVSSDAAMRSISDTCVDREKHMVIYRWYCKVHLKRQINVINNTFCAETSIFHISYHVSPQKVHFSKINSTLRIMLNMQLSWAKFMVFCRGVTNPLSTTTKISLCLKNVVFNVCSLQV